MALDTRLEAALALPFAQAIEFFRAKLDLPTDAWDDIWQEAHDRAFVVAGAFGVLAGAALLMSVHRPRVTQPA